MRRRPVPHLALALAMVAAGAAPASATPPLLTPHVGGGVFVGPVDAHVTAMYWNPAAAGLMSGTHIYLGGTARLDLTGVDRATISSANGEPSASGDQGFAPLTLTPITVDNFFGVVSDLSSNDLTVGFAIFSPYSENLPTNDTLAYHAAGGSSYGEAMTLGLSYRLFSWLIVGANFNLLVTHLHLQFWRDTALDACTTPPCGVENPARAEKYDLDAGFFSFPTIYVNVGIVLRLWGWYVGIASSNLFSGTALARNDGTARVIPAGGTEPIGGNSAIRTQLPLTIDIGARRRLFESWDLVLGFRYSNLAAQDTLDVRLFGQELTRAGIPDWIVRARGLRDLFWFEAGLEQPPAQRLRLGARVRVSTGAVPENLVAIDQLDGPTAELSGGLQIRLTERFGLDVGYTLSLLLPRDVTDSAFSPAARIDCNAASFDITTPSCTAVRLGRGIPTAAGTYSRIGNALTLALTYDIW